MQEITQGSGYDGFSRVLLKHMMADARDCMLAWKANFSDMEIVLRVDFISPALLVDFLQSLLRKEVDERFSKAGVADVVDMSKRFNIKLCVTSESRDTWYRLSAYRPLAPLGSSARTEIELLPLFNEA